MLPGAANERRALARPSCRRFVAVWPLRAEFVLDEALGAHGQLADLGFGYLVIRAYGFALVPELVRDQRGEEDDGQHASYNFV